MSRPLQIDDYAVITINNQRYLLVITGIKQSYIVAGQYNIIKVGNRWQVQNYPMKHFVMFVAAPPPSLTTHLPEITSQILLNLDYDELMNACRINKDFNKVCHDDYFWKLKIEHDFGTITHYKLPNISHHQQYIYLMATKNPNRAAAEDRLDILEWLAQYNIFPDENGANEAVKSGQLKVVKWLLEHNIEPDQYIIDEAASSDDWDMLELLADFNFYPDADEVAEKGKNYCSSCEEI